MSSVAEALAALYDQTGYITPELVVERATAKSHPLHDRFEWDNRKAGHLYRLDQARDLIRSVNINFVRKDGEPGETRRYINFKEPDGHRYRDVEEVTDDPFLTKLALRNMEREWRALFARYQKFDEFRQLVRADLDEGQAV